MVSAMAVFPPSSAPTAERLGPITPIGPDCKIRDREREARFPASSAVPPEVGLPN